MAAGRQAWREGEREGSGDLVTTGQASGILERTLATWLWEGCWLNPPSIWFMSALDPRENEHVEA